MKIELNFYEREIMGSNFRRNGKFFCWIGVFYTLKFPLLCVLCILTGKPAFLAKYTALGTFFETWAGFNFVPVLQK